MRKGYSLGRRNFRALKSKNQILSVVKIVTEKVIRQQVSINEMFGFMQGHGTANIVNILRQLEE